MSFFSFFFKKPANSPIERFLKTAFQISATNLVLYELALRHRSASLKTSNIKMNNERLEFLGDAILDSVAADYLYRNYPKEDEGFMSKMRAKIVSRSSLEQIAISLDIPSVLVHNSSSIQRSESLYGNAFEALIGAIYLDKGFDKTKDLITSRIFSRFIDFSELENTSPDSKSTLLEWGQKEKKTIVFETKDSENTTENERFVSIVYIENEEKGKGFGSSKKKAEQEAAKEVLTSFQFIRP